MDSDGSPRRLAPSRASDLRRMHRAALAPVIPLVRGSMIAGKYRIASLLGEGGMGAVYRAEHVAMQRPVALKVMRPELATDRAMGVRFEREARAASRIATPHVVTIYDYGSDDEGLLYIAMELLEGESLAERIERERQLAWTDAVSIALQIARALAIAHDAGVVHRDLKPDNVFLCAHGLLKVLDFGIARFIRKDDAPITADLTQAGTILGTALYMSPEAAARREIGPPADLYALGAMLFEMVTGRLLFEEEQVVLLMGMHLRIPPERVREVCPELDLPPALDDLIDRMLDKAPDARPSATEVVAELETLLTTSEHGVPVITGQRSVRIDRPSTRTADRDVEVRAPVSTLSPRTRRWAPITALLSIAIAIAIAYVLVPGQRPRPAPRVRATPPAAAPAPPPAPDPPATVAIRFEVDPPDALVMYEGAPLEGRQLVALQDGSEQLFEIRADGYEPQSRRVRAERDQRIEVRLERVRAERPARPRPPQKRESGTLMGWSD